jgi:hypothetical protein
MFLVSPFEITFTITLTSLELGVSSPTLIGSLLSDETSFDMSSTPVLKQHEFDKEALKDFGKHANACNRLLDYK